MSPLLTEFGGPGGESSARGFQWLRDGELWEFRDNFEGDSVAARSVENGEPPLVGLALPAAEILTRAEARLETVVTLSRGALADVDQSRLLHRTGLGGYENAQGESDDTREPDTTLIPVQRVAEAGQATGPAGRRQGRYSRIIRNSAFAQRVKELHEGTCQVCGTTLEHGGRSFVQAAHIQGLGDPHNGPDVLSNLLCLCPNDHALFDGFALYIDERWTVRTQEGVSLGTLRRVPQHTIDTSYVAYHRRLCALSTSATRR
jgi:putative restriction endonuclease